MANTWAGTPSLGCIEKRAIYDAEANGVCEWSGAAPSWSTDDSLVTWNDLNTYVDMDASTPTGNWCPHKSEASNHFVAAPTETPNTPSLSFVDGIGGETIEATWTNTTNEWQVQVVFECTTDFTYNATFNEPAGTTSKQYTPGTPDSETFVCRVRYFNDAGYGPFSEDSNQLIGV